MQTDRRTKRELIALLEQQQAQLDVQNAAMARGRRKGADVIKLGAALRQSLVERAVNDLLRNSEAAKWRPDAVVEFCFSRQTSLGLRPHYAITTLDRIVRKAIKKACAKPSLNGS